MGGHESIADLDGTPRTRDAEDDVDLRTARVKRTNGEGHTPADRHRKAFGAWDETGHSRSGVLRGQTSGDEHRQRDQGREEGSTDHG